MASREEIRLLNFWIQNAVNCVVLGLDLIPESQKLFVATSKYKLFAHYSYSNFMTAMAVFSLHRNYVSHTAGTFNMIGRPLQLYDFALTFGYTAIAAVTLFIVVFQDELTVLWNQILAFCETGIEDSYHTVTFREKLFWYVHKSFWLMAVSVAWR